MQEVKKVQEETRQEQDHYNPSGMQRPRSRIIDAIRQAAQGQSTDEGLSYSDYCDWHDTCDCNE